MDRMRLLAELRDLANSSKLSAYEIAEVLEELETEFSMLASDEAAESAED